MRSDTDGLEGKEGLSTEDCIREALALNDQEKIARILKELTERRMHPEIMEDPRIEVVLRDLRKLGARPWKRYYLSRILHHGLDVVHRLNIAEIDFLGGFDLSDAKKEEVKKGIISPVLRNILRIPSLYELPQLTKEQKFKLLNLVYVNFCFEDISYALPFATFPLPLGELGQVFAQEEMFPEAMELLVQNEVDRMKLHPQNMSREELDLALTREIHDQILALIVDIDE